MNQDELMDALVRRVAALESRQVQLAKVFQEAGSSFIEGEDGLGWNVPEIDVDALEAWAKSVLADAGADRGE